MGVNDCSGRQGFVPLPDLMLNINILLKRNLPFDFVRSDAQHDCCSIVCLRFQVVETKQVDYKTSTKNVNNYK